ncbi:MAG TPA: type II CAAX endopeptidase family protein [Chthoniobacterales bacterium]|nr:type II CAAX endopeptidase family protein [Chthoniobacterales bacterium]
MRGNGPKSPERVPEKARATLSPNDGVAGELRGFGPLGILAIVIILAGNAVIAPLSAVLVLVWARLSRTAWREIGYVRPKSWALTLAGGIVFGAAFKLLMKAVVMPLFGAPPINQAFHYLVGNTAALPAILFAVIIGAGFGEETVFRGWMFERFGKLFGSGARAKAAIVLITSIWFGWDHFALQGLPGVQQATLFGLVFGTIFAITGRIWLLIIAHAAFDLMAVAIIYWDLESAVAHFFFK